MNARPDVIPAQRRRQLLTLLQERGGGSVQELSDVLGISPSTVRRDLELLEQEGQLQRTHGGAVVSSATRSTFEPEAAIAALASRVEKRAIAQAAAARVAGGDSVVFDSGSTILATARIVIDRQIPITGVTNDLIIGHALSKSDKVRTVILGGSIRHGSPTMIGEPGRSFIAGVHADLAFIGVHAISGRLLTETSIEIAAMKRAFITSARRVILLADSTKFRPPVFCDICDITAVHELITDAGTDPAVVDAIRALGVAVTVVDVPQGDSGR
jgi:DeoR family transcriptional regulator of aga operon